MATAPILTSHLTLECKMRIISTLLLALIWIVELVRIDINVEASMLLSHLVLPQEGHFQELLRVFACLKKHTNTEIMFDPSEPDIDIKSFHLQDWSYLIYSSLVTKSGRLFHPACLSHLKMASQFVDLWMLTMQESL